MFGSARNIMLWSALSFPAAWCLISSGNSAPSPLSLPAPARPAMAFNQYQVNLGRIEPRNLTQARFVFHHQGTQPIEIDRVNPSCGCLAPKFDKQTYEPGESGELLLKVQPATEKPGPHDYFVEVSYRDPEPRQVRLTFKVIIPERQIQVEPRSLLFYQFTGQETTHEIFVSDTRGRPLHVNDVSCDLPYVSAVVGERTQSSDGIFGQAVLVTAAAQVPPGRHQGVLTIHTNDPEQSVLRVPVWVEGKRKVYGPETP